MNGMEPVLEMNEWIWNKFKADLADVTPEEVDWRPLPQSNTVNIIVRHLRIEGQWHTASLEHGEIMPSDVSPSLQAAIDAVPFDFERNMKELDEQYTRFLAVLRRTTLSELGQRTAAAYSGSPRTLPPHTLGFHQVMHLAGHHAQIRTIRTLYKKTRGEPVPAKYFPDNPTYPK